MIMKIKDIKKEHASYSMEASVSLIAFMLAIMFIYTQIKVMICESILQHAVDNMAAEMATYVYVLDRAGLIIETNPDEFKDLDNAVSAAGGAYNDTRSFISGSIDSFTNIYSSLEGGDVKGAVTEVGTIKGNAGSMVDSIKNMVNMIKAVDWKEAGVATARAGGANALKAISNEVLSDFYNWKLDAYLPAERGKFCQSFLIDPKSISFDYSKIFPTSNNDNVVVAVSYETLPAFRMFPLKRKVVKVACSAAWVSGNTNQLKSDNTAFG